MMDWLFLLSFSWRWWKYKWLGLVWHCWWWWRRWGLQAWWRPPRGRRSVSPTLNFTHFVFTSASAHFILVLRAVPAAWWHVTWTRPSAFTLQAFMLKYIRRLIYYSILKWHPSQCAVEALHCFGSLYTTDECTSQTGNETSEEFFFLTPPSNLL